MLQHTRIVAVAAAVVLTARCSDAPSNPAATPPPKSPDASVVGPLAARAIALAMAEPAIRQQILGDMRDSPFSEHKLVLQDYFATPAGARVLDAIQQTGIDADDLRNKLKASRPIQFYVPSTDQRSSWRGSADVIVVANLTREQPTLGFTPTGETQAIALEKRRMPNGVGALFLLQWAEPMFHRWSGPTAATETIQKPNESQIGSGRVIRDARGHIFSTTDDTPAGASRVAASATFEEPAGTYLTYLQNRAGICDNLCIGDEHLEFEFRSTASDNPTTYVSSQLSGIGTDAGSAWAGWWQVHTSRVWSPITMEVQVWEIDDSSPDDPYYCSATDAHCSPGISQWPYLTDPYQNHGPWPFGLCHDPNMCGAQYPDFWVTFTDRATPVATRVTVSPQNATINKGATQAFTAQVQDQYGGLMPSAVATWTSANTSVATVASTGNQSATATGVGGGQAAIYATVGDASRGATLTVLAPATVTVSPSSISICSNGGGGFLTASVKDQNGTVWTPGSVAWSSSNTSAATVALYDPRTGRVTGGALGSATITATLDGVSGTSDVTVGTCLPAPTSCTLDYIPTPHYLKVAWVNADASASTEVWVMESAGSWQLVRTASPGATQEFYVVGPGLWYARVRHVKAGYLPSTYCNTNAKTVP
jgi:uncharacterized protein YjdB